MLTFDYFHGDQADQFSFIRIPRKLMTDKLFADLSPLAKMLYALLLDRISLSSKNGWIDEQDRVYIIYQISDIMEDLGLGKKKAMDLLAELESFGLVEKQRRGRGLPNILYVKSFLSVSEAKSVEPDSLKNMEVSNGPSANTDSASGTDEITTSRSAEINTSKNPETSRGAEIGTSRSAQIDTSRGAEIELLEVPKAAPLNNKIDLNNINMSDTKSNLISSSASVGDEMRLDNDAMPTPLDYRELIKDNIAYHDFLITHPEDIRIIDGIVDLILESVLCTERTMVIASRSYPSSIVKSKLLKLNYANVEYVLFSLSRNTTKVKNIKKYLLAVLFNASSTMDSFYHAEVRHDMAQEHNKAS